MENKEENIKTRLGKSKQGYGYRYTDLAQIHEYCEDNNIKYYQYIDRIDNDDYIMTVVTENDKKLEARRGCRIVQATLQGIKNPAQEQGSALTYARRYSLLMALGLATEDDDGAKLNQSKQVGKKQEPTAEQELKFVYLGKIKSLLVDTNTDYDQILKYFKVKSNGDMNLEQLKQTVEILEKKKNKNKEEVF